MWPVTLGKQMKTEFHIILVNKGELVLELMEGKE